MPEIHGTIGPYTILHRLGAGGMGEVFSARDERLKRRVAIKRLHPEGTLTGEGLARFRREAQLAAQLNHPAIVQIYDVLEHEGSEFIVMELVEGESLAHRRAAGPLPLRDSLRIALDVVDGLAAAHGRGIIHRDLKTENVLVTAQGRAKIADFGIAKSLDPEAEEDPLTATTAVVGTRRALAPEQIRGEELDERTDLHAFGVLLYELLIGSSPFGAPSAERTIGNVLEVTPPPVGELDGRIPDELSALVTYLLRKDPNLRPRSAVEVGQVLRRIAARVDEEGGGETTVADGREPWLHRSPGTSTPTDGSFLHRLGLALWRRPALRWWAVLLLAGPLAASYFALRNPPAPLSVAVRQPRLAGGEAHQLVAAGVHTALLRGLLALEGLSPKPAEEVDPVAGTATEVARATAADEVLTSALDCLPGSCRVTVQRLRGTDGGLLWAEDFDIPVDDFELAARAVESSLRRAYGDRRLRQGFPDLSVESVDLEELLRLRSGFDRTALAAQEELLAKLAALRRHSPRFLEVYLLEADIHRRRFVVSRQKEHLDGALDLLEAARSLAPGDPRIPAMKAQVALDGGLLEVAASALDDLEALAPGDVQVQVRRALLQDARGEPREALELMTAAARRQPSWRWLVELARMEYGLGAIEAARGHLEEALERSPGNYQALSSLALLELVDGEPSRAVDLYQRLVAETPGLAELSNLGLAYLLEGRYREAAEAYRQVYDREPANPLFALNLADAYQLMGKNETARGLYDRVIALAEEDPSASHWQLLTAKAQALAHRGQARSAVEAVQVALRQAPDNSQALYEAALVYAVVGEDASSQVFAERALALGYGARWFAYPWFDQLRSDARFRRLLDPSSPEP